MSYFLRTPDLDAAPDLEEPLEGKHSQPRAEALALQGAAATRRIGGRKIQRGEASYYGTSTRAQYHKTHQGDGFIGAKQANGTPLNPHAMTAAHKTLPLGSKIGVRAVESGKEVVVEITDRGPYVAGRILDGTVAVANALGYKDEGHAEVELFAEPNETGGKQDA